MRSRATMAGQAMTEFVIAVTVIALVLLGTTGIFLVHVGDFYEKVVRIICLPFP